MYCASIYVNLSNFFPRNGSEMFAVLLGDLDHHPSTVHLVSSFVPPLSFFNLLSIPTVDDSFVLAIWTIPIILNKIKATHVTKDNNRAQWLEPVLFHGQAKQSTKQNTSVTSGFPRQSRWYGYKHSSQTIALFSSSFVSFFFLQICNTEHIR